MHPIIVTLVVAKCIVILSKRLSRLVTSTGSMPLFDSLPTKYYGRLDMGRTITGIATYNYMLTLIICFFFSSCYKKYFVACYSLLIVRPYVYKLVKLAKMSFGVAPSTSSSANIFSVELLLAIS